MQVVFGYIVEDRYKTSIEECQPGHQQLQLLVGNVFAAASEEPPQRQVHFLTQEFILRLELLVLAFQRAHALLEHLIFRVQHCRFHCVGDLILGGGILFKVFKTTFSAAIPPGFGSHFQTAQHSR